MAATVTIKTSKHWAVATLSWTADGDGIISFPRPVRKLSFTSNGADGGGTLTWFVSNNSSNYSAFAAQTSADPKNAVAVTSATAAGNWQTNHDLGPYAQYKFTLAAATTPALVVTAYAELL